MAKAPQLAAVIVALVLVLGAAGYGITRGLTSEHEASSTETTWRSAPACRSRTGRLPVPDSLTLPARLPEGVCLSLVNYSEGAPGTLWYDNQQGNKVLLVSFFKTASFPSSTQSGTPVQLGNLVGYVYDTTEPDGTRSYNISFDKTGWTYYVFAQFGMRANEPDNTITPDEVKAAALSMAVQ